MSASPSYTTNDNLFQRLAYLLGKGVQSDLVRKIEYLKVENQVLRSKLGRRVMLSASEKRRLVRFGLALGGEIRQYLSIASYATFRRWVSGDKRKRPSAKRGRPQTRKKVQELLLRLARENPSWGYTRILGELKKLDIYSLSRNTVKNILRANGFDPAPQRGEDSWDAFIKRHFETLWACDFFTKTVWTLLGPKTFHVLFFIHVHTRKVHIAGMSPKPNQVWVTEQARPFKKLLKHNAKSPGLLIRDGDKKYSRAFDELFRSDRFQVKRIPYRSPNLNPYAEGWIGTLKRECLNHFVVFGKEHLTYLVKEFVQYYNTTRPHSGLGNRTIGDVSGHQSGRVRRTSRLGGLVNHYYGDG